MGWSLWKACRWSGWKSIYSKLMYGRKPIVNEYEKSLNDDWLFSNDEMNENNALLSRVIEHKNVKMVKMVKIMKIMKIIKLWRRKLWKWE